MLFTIFDKLFTRAAKMLFFKTIKIKRKNFFFFCLIEGKKKLRNFFQKFKIYKGAEQKRSKIATYIISIEVI